MSELEKFLRLEEQLKPYIKMMSQAADTIIVQEVSKYPIFVVHQQEGHYCFERSLEHVVTQSS